MTHFIQAAQLYAINYHSNEMIIKMMITLLIHLLNQWINLVGTTWNAKNVWQA